MMHLWIFALGLYSTQCQAGTKDKPHGHNGILDPYDGRHISYEITMEQNAKLESGSPVTFNEKSSAKAGRGVVIQDINAAPSICMSKIRDLPNYHKVVPNVKKVEIYEEKSFQNGTVKTSAAFTVGIYFLTFSYFLDLKFDPSFYTFSWTLDFRHKSDFDDSTGHWQVMPHPHKDGWSRVLYSTELKLFPWIPDMVVTFLTKTALIESTTWVKKESEKARNDAAQYPSMTMLVDLKKCFTVDGDKAKYSTECIESFYALDKKEEIVEDTLSVATEGTTEVEQISDEQAGVEHSESVEQQYVEEQHVEEQHKEEQHVDDSNNEIPNKVEESSNDIEATNTIEPIPDNTGSSTENISEEL